MDAAEGVDENTLINAVANELGAEYDLIIDTPVLVRSWTTSPRSAPAPAAVASGSSTAPPSLSAAAALASSPSTQAKPATSK